MASLALSWWRTKRGEVEFVMNGALAGLVAITANCDVVSAPSALIIGGVGGIVMMLVSGLLEHLRIDDAVGAVPVHLGAGIWGTLAVALFGQPELLDTGLTMLEQLKIQIVGILACGAWAFGLAFVILKTLHRFVPLRVSPDDEHIGLNVAEHGATIELLELFRTMESHARTEDLSVRAPVEPFTEVGQIALRYNEVMGKLEISNSELNASNERLGEALKEARRLADEAQVANRAKSEFLANISHEIRTPMNAILGFSEILSRQITDEKHQSHLTAINLSGNALLELINDILDLTTVRLFF